MASLYVIATPIGNLEDISLRALRILKEEVNIIYCEDTRVTAKLLNFYQIEGKKLISFNKDNENKRIKEIKRCLINSEDVAICSDAGTPLVSDPGQSLITACFEDEFELVPLPGASALTTALSVCPIDTSRFIYEGFLPHSPQKRRRVLRDLLGSTRPIVIFESPHRIKKCLEDIKNILGEKEVFIARELTKKFEQLYYGSVEQVQAQLEEQFPKDVQGEFVLVIGTT
ncbi:MAG: 16S rRNA (cytidine(1402)-2'-O)-methyltransferase [Candidatus Melainabacteria bacterium]|nr:16S rRNA (cytidine(1402)-2'-O)-methyltransferase [Candidatus Melainabacteria bacterium]